MNKAGDALMRRQAESIEHAAVVGLPFGDPVRPVAEGVRGEDKAHGRGAGVEDLLPFRDFHMRAGAAHHGDHEWRARRRWRSASICSDFALGYLVRKAAAIASRPNA